MNVNVGVRECWSFCIYWKAISIYTLSVMKRPIVFFLIFMSMLMPAVSQQVIWSTVENDSIGGRAIKHVPIDEVIHEVGKFYDFYDFYYDGTGYSKEMQAVEFEAAEKNDPGNSSLRSFMLRKFSSVEPVAVCLKTNEGRGSIISVIYINGSNLDMLAYSNQYEEGGNFAHNVDREKFLNWFRQVM